MPAKVRDKLKGMIFVERRARRPGSPLKSSVRDDSRAGLISYARKDGEAAGAGDTDGEESDDARTERLTRKRSARQLGARCVDGKEDSDSATVDDMMIGDGENPRLHWQRSLRERVMSGPRRQHDSTSHVHVNDGSAREEPIRHYMQSKNNTPVRQLEKKSSATDVGDDQRLLLNVGGVRHETHVATLKNVPSSRLSRLAEWHVSSGGGRLEYFFDRHPAVFNSIIDFYRTGELHVPLEVCGAVVKRELDFWQIEEYQIKACCWRHYRSYIENQRILNSFNRSLEHEQDTVDLSSLRGWKLWQMKMWLILDHPRTSRMAMLYGITSFLFVAASIAGFCLETLPHLRPQVMSNLTNTSCGGGKKLQVIQTSNEALNVLDFTCTVFFTLELLLRFCVSPSKRQFVLSPMNIIDLLALVPLYVQVIFEQSNLQSCYMNERFVIEIMFILRIFRMFRIFHLVKHYQALKVLVYALRASLQELLMLFIFLLIAMLVFATMIYYAERSDDFGAGSEFSTIPIGFWWAIITMTTVGYGDVTPSTPIGYIVGTACSVCGVLLVALTFPVISNNFSLFYEHVRSRSLSPRVKGDPSHDEDINYNDYEIDTDGKDAFGAKRHSHTHAKPVSSIGKRVRQRDADDEDLGFLHDQPLYGSVSLSMHHMAPRRVSPHTPRRHSHAGSVRRNTEVCADGDGQSKRDTVNGRARSTVTPTGKVSKYPSAGYIPLAKFSDSDIVLQETADKHLV